MNPQVINEFQLYSPDKNNNPSLEFTCQDIKFNIDLVQFTKSSYFLSKKQNDYLHLSEQNRQADPLVLLDDILKRIEKSLEIERYNYLVFLSIISGKKQKISNESLFDLYKLSYSFEINKLLDFIKNTCKVAKIQDVFTIIRRGSSFYTISKNEENLYNDFIKFGEMDKLLGENITKFFEDINYENNFPLSTLFIILRNCKSQEGIPANKLYQMISKSFEKQLHFLPYLNIFQLNESLQKKLFEQINAIEKELSPSEEESKKQIANENLLHTDIQNGPGKETDHFNISKVPSQKSSQNDDNSLFQSKTYKSNISNTANHNDKALTKSIKTDSALSASNSNKSNNDSISLTRSNNPSSNNAELTTSQQGIKAGTTTTYNSNKSLDKSTKADGLNTAYSSKNSDSISRSRSNNPSSNNSELTATTKQGIKRTESDNKYHPPTSFKNKQRIEVFNENKKIVHNGYYTATTFHNIKKDFEYSLANTILISDHQHLHLDYQIASRAKHLTISDKVQICKNVEVTPESTFAAAIRGKKYFSKKLCVLNFASATQPGGGVLNGRNAQEEVLSRQSTLYFSIAQMKDFYEHNKKNNDPIGTDYMIYSPNVIILRDDNDKLIDPVKVSVISSVAVNYGEILEKNKGDLDEYVSNVMVKRCRRILELCIDKGNDVFVLGAFGCGVFKNPPELISEIFKFLIVDEGYGLFFKKIIFAIKIKPDQTTELIDTFKNAFLPPKPQNPYNKK